MLVLTRKLGEKLVIDGDIIVTVVGIQRGKVRLGVVAPEYIDVDRQEVHQRRRSFAAGAGSGTRRKAVW
jgi:carbon storage regulator